MANKVGPLIKEARTDAGFTQEQLARKIKGLSAADLGKAERGEKELTQATLKEIAKATGVTQTSLITAAKESTYGDKASPKKTTTKKTTTAAKKTTTAKKTAAKKTDDELTLTATEKKLVKLYRDADKDMRDRVMKLLKGEEDEGSGDLISSLLGGAMDLLGKK